MSLTDWIAIDFGSANIRVVRAAATFDPTAVNPLPVQFDGQPALPNLAYLTLDEAALAHVGADVLRLDPAAVDLRRLRFGATLDAGPDDEAGQAARLLLGHLAATLERDHGRQPDAAGTTTLVAAPIIRRAGADPAARLREAGWPVEADAASDSALAALAHAEAGRPAPGRYGIIDLGAARTRFALVECPAGGQPSVVVRSHNSPGGVDFDTALLAHFAPQLPPTSEGGVELVQRAAVEAFKHAFAEAWADGQAAHSAVYDVGGTRITLALAPATFGAPEVAGGLIAHFRTVADDFFRAHAPDGDLVRVILVGGGAHWPFVYDWAVGRFGADRVWRDAFPEQAVVRGLPRLAAMRLTSAAAPGPGAGPGPGAAGDVGGGSGGHGKRPKPTTMAAGPAAAALEFFGGLVGFLGLGWFFGARRVGVGCPALLAWWATLALLVALGVASAVSNRPVLIIPLALLWLGVPALSAVLLHRRLRGVPPG